MALESLRTGAAVVIACRDPAVVEELTGYALLARAFQILTLCRQPGAAPAPSGNVQLVYDHPDSHDPADVIEEIGRRCGQVDAVLSSGACRLGQAISSKLEAMAWGQSSRLLMTEETEGCPACRWR